MNLQVSRSPRRRYWIAIRVLPVILISTILLSACGSGEDPTLAASPTPDPGFTVNVRLSEFSVELDSDSLPLNVPVTFVVANTGSIEHNIILEAPGAVDMPLLNPDGSPARLDGLKSGQIESFTYTFVEGPDFRPGTTLQLGCHLPGHYEAGMLAEFRLEN